MAVEKPHRPTQLLKHLGTMKHFAAVAVQQRIRSAVLFSQSSRAEPAIAHLAYTSDSSTVMTFLRCFVVHGKRDGKGQRGVEGLGFLLPAQVRLGQEQCCVTFERAGLDAIHHFERCAPSSNSAYGSMKL